MKIFISWSGELSKRVAELLHEWLPCWIDNIEVFYSPEDIEKGENWDQRLSKELAGCNYGLVCLTPENVSSPWINFEAGAIAKSLDSRLISLLIGLNPSDLKGPISRYQAAKVEKKDIFHLLRDINQSSDNLITQNVLEMRFNGLWDSFNRELQTILQNYPGMAKSGNKANEKVSSDAVEEILQLVRKQYSILTKENDIADMQKHLEEQQLQIKLQQDEIYCLNNENLKRYEVIKALQERTKQLENERNNLQELIIQKEATIKQMVQSSREREMYNKILQSAEERKKDNKQKT